MIFPRLGIKFVSLFYIGLPKDGIQGEKGDWNQKDRAKEWGNHRSPRMKGIIQFHPMDDGIVESGGEQVADKQANQEHQEDNRELNGASSCWLESEHGIGEIGKRRCSDKSHRVGNERRDIGRCSLFEHKIVKNPVDSHVNERVDDANNAKGKKFTRQKVVFDKNPQPFQSVLSSEDS
jgi:hypothetical protein